MGPASMRVVHLTWGIPWPPNSGAKIRDEALIRRVAAEGIEVALICFAKDEREIPDLAPLEAICASVDVVRPPQPSLLGTLRRIVSGFGAGRPLAMQEFYFEQLAKVVRGRLVERDTCILQIEHSLMASYVACASGLPGVRTVLSLHNLGWLQYRRMAQLPHTNDSRVLAWLKALLMRNWEAAWARRFDLCITVSDADRRLLIEHAATREGASPLRVATIPNGVDVSQTALSPVPRSADLLFVGILGYPPNADAVTFFCREVLPLVRRAAPQARVLIVGAGAGEEIRQLASDSVVLLGEVPDLRPLYEACRAAVVPLRAGSGTRFKILEAFALGRPVVSTTVGAEGISAEHERHLLLADTPEDFAAAILRLLSDDALCARLARQARELAERDFAWSSIGARLVAHYRELAPSGAEEQHD